MNKVEKIRAEIARLHDEEWLWRRSIEAKYRREAYKELLDFIDSLNEEPVKRKVKVNIELSPNGFYSFYTNEDYSSCVINAARTTKEEAIQYFEDSYREIVCFHTGDGMPEECEFEYVDMTMEDEK